MFTDWPWRHWRQRRGAAPALRLNDERLNWREVCARIDALAAGFQAQGVGDGDGVILRAANHPQTLLAWLALLQCGGRVLPLNPHLPLSVLSPLLSSPGLYHGLALNGASPVPGLHPLRLQSGCGAGAVAWRPWRLASMTLTSGSGGSPKAAAHTFAAHLASARGVLSQIPYHPSDDWLLSLPLFHVSGQGMMWRWLLAGGRLTVAGRQPLAQALCGCSHASLVPTQLWRLLRDQAEVSLKAVLLGGAAIPPPLIRQARERGIRSWCGYGLTEFASTVCAGESGDAADVGRPLPGVALRIVAEELWLRGESMAAGYWRDGQLAPLVNQHGWFATGDRGELRAGKVIIAGRMDNLFFSAGEGIQPEALERVIIAHPRVRQIFIVPLDDQEYGQRPVAVVECEPDFSITALAGWVRDRLARFQWPVEWLALPQALKNGGIKISRQALKAWVGQTLRG